MNAIAYNDLGRRIGEDHQNAQLSNHEVELLLRMRVEHKFGYKRLARAFEISKAQVRRIVAGQQRCQLVVAYRVPVRLKVSVKVPA